MKSTDIKNIRKHVQADSVAKFFNESIKITTLDNKQKKLLQLVKKGLTEGEKENNYIKALQEELGGLDTDGKFGFLTYNALRKHFNQEPIKKNKPKDEPKSKYEKVSPPEKREKSDFIKNFETKSWNDFFFKNDQNDREIRTDILHKAGNTAYIELHGKYYKCNNNGCVNGDLGYYQGKYYPRKSHADNALYIGTYNGRVLNGEGAMFSDKGDKYVGNYKNGQMEGRGIFINHDGSKYEGQRKNGQREGRGTFIRPNKSKYEGQRKNGQMEGRGTFISSDGSKCEGERKNGELVQ